MLKQGDEAPKFKAPTFPEGQVDLGALGGKKVVLFFYPKDDTPGCTIESCEFRDMQADFAAANAIVFGISADDVASHSRFTSKFNLNFPLIADTDKKISSAYGVWGEQEWQGKKYMGIARTTYVIDEQGKVARVYEKVNPKGHAAAVLKELH